ncbi:MAG: pyrimidine-nucleoside phosphorylase, partial [Bacillus sp. (in: Bacteria)]|nr:pyrimidine-nucleoside phosphorylase [Bacillus sp. (in: firmicutes)]
MRMVDIIEKKRNGLELAKEEIQFLITGFTNESIPDYQMSAFSMAVFFQGMTKEERVYLTEAMVQSGDKIDLSGIKGIKVDKHSTGGVGDTTTLVLAPLVASVGVPVAKMSG